MPVRDAMVNRSPEQATDNRRFQMPLFPGHQNAVDIDASDVAALKKQQADFACHSEEQSQQSQSAIGALQRQLASQSTQNQSEMRQMREDWNRQFTSFAQTTLAQATLAQTALQEQLTQRQSDRSSVNSTAVSQASYRKRTLSHIPTTYQVPKRIQVRWMERLLSWVPKFLWLFFLGIALSVLCAIALTSSNLAPVGLLSSLGSSIRFTVPYLFVLSVVSLGITAVWDTFR